MSNGDFTFSIADNMLTPSGRSRYEKLMEMIRDWDAENQDRLAESPMRLRLNLDDESLLGLYR